MLRYSVDMDRRLRTLLDLLDRAGGEAVGTSVRLPANLRDAAVLATELGLADTTTDLTVRGLHDVLDGMAQRAILDEHYGAHPDSRPDLAEIALAAAALDGNPLASRPEVVRRAADEVVALRADPTPDDILLYAAGLAAASAA
jgi:hypothetical protein